MRGAQRLRHVPIIFVTAARRSNTASSRLRRRRRRLPLSWSTHASSRHKTETFYELHQQEAAVEETLHLAETFMAAVGHDLKTPLNTVMLGAELIASNPTSDTEPSDGGEAQGQHPADAADDRRPVRSRAGAPAGGIPIVHAPADLLKVVRRSLTEIETAHPR